VVRKIIILDDKMPFYFTMTVREGDHGFADDDLYTSCQFDTLEACERAYYDFKPEIRWPFIRCVA
jgi:hypothetical protein